MRYRVMCGLAAVLLCALPSADGHDVPDDFTHPHKPEKKVEKHADPWDFLKNALSPAYAFTNNVHLYRQGAYRVITANGIPDHPTGQFPNRGNPNAISEQHYNFKMPINGAYAQTITALSQGPFGIALNGVLFDPGTAEYWHQDRSSGWHYEAMYQGSRLGLDSNNAHVQPNGAYHYHGPPTDLLARLRGIGRPVLIGYAADGFPIYGPFGYKKNDDSKSGITKLRPSYRLRSGTRPGGPGGPYTGTFEQDFEYVRGLGDLDECNGRFGITPEYATGTYYYVITDAYPFIPRAFHGQPDESFRRGGPGSGPAPGGPGGRSDGFGAANGGPPIGGPGRFGGPNGGPPGGFGGPNGGPPGGFGGPNGGPPGGFGGPNGGPPGGFGGPNGGPPGGFGGPNGGRPGGFGGPNGGSPGGFGGPNGGPPGGFGGPNGGQPNGGPGGFGGPNGGQPNGGPDLRP